MKFKENEIFAEYARIALEQGLIEPEITATAEEDKEDKPKSSKDENEWYGLNTGKSLDELLDDAHPATVVVGPAYDRMNGVVENLKQRKDMMDNIVLNTPRAIQTQHRYISAYNDLLSETIKLGYFLDNSELKELATLADDCSEQITKEALAPLAIAGIALLVAAIGGAVYSTNNPSTQGIKNDLADAIVELNDAMDEHDFPQLKATLGYFVSLLQSTLTDISKLESKLDIIRKDIIEFKSSSPEDKISNAIKIGGEIFDNHEDEHIKELLRSVKESLHTILSATPDVINELRGARNRYESSDWSVWKKVKDLWQNSSAGEQFGINSDTEDAARQLEVLQQSANNYLQEADKQIIALDQLKSQLSIHEDPKQTLSPKDPSFVAPQNHSKEIERYLHNL